MSHIDNELYNKSSFEMEYESKWQTGENIMANKIEVITCESGDWEVLKVNGKVINKSHPTDNHLWLYTFKSLGFNIDRKEISDEDMEYGRY